MTTLPNQTKRFAHIDPNLVVVNLKVRGGVVHTITRKIADYIGAQGANEQVCLPSGDWINTSDVSSMTVDDAETIANIKRTERPLQMNSPTTTPEQFMAIAESYAAKNAGFRKIYADWKGKKRGILARSLDGVASFPLDISKI